MEGKLFQKYLPRLLDACFPRGKFTSTPSNTASNTGSDASGDPGTLFKTEAQQPNRPHCLCWRPAIRQPRKAANARNNLDG